jgi:hypothetical protein
MLLLVALAAAVPAAALLWGGVPADAPGVCLTPTGAPRLHRLGGTLGAVVAACRLARRRCCCYCSCRRCCVASSSCCCCGVRLRVRVGRGCEAARPSPAPSSSSSRRRHCRCSHCCCCRCRARGRRPWRLLHVYLDLLGGVATACCCRCCTDRRCRPQHCVTVVGSATQHCCCAHAELWHGVQVPTHTPHNGGQVHLPIRLWVTLITLLLPLLLLRVSATASCCCFTWQ